MQEGKRCWAVWREIIWPPQFVAASMMTGLMFEGIFGCQGGRWRYGRRWCDGEGGLTMLVSVVGGGVRRNRRFLGGHSLLVD